MRTWPCTRPRAAARGGRSNSRNGCIARRWTDSSSKAISAARVERGDFLLLYQPIVNLETAAVTGMEALVRWVHPRRGTLYPSQFIPLAEETGLIVPLGEWVLQEACRQAKEWEQRWRPAVPLAISVNVSGQQFRTSASSTAVQKALHRAQLRAESLVLEITESVLMQHTETMLERLTELKAVGVQLAIDDFGTGYSSLSYLQRFPIDILKIAKPFVDDVGVAAAIPSSRGRSSHSAKRWRCAPSPKGSSSASNGKACAHWAANSDRATTSPVLLPQTQWAPSSHTTSAPHASS